MNTTLKTTLNTTTVHKYVRTLRQASDIDVAFPAGAGDDHLLQELRRVLPNEFALNPPDLVLYGEI